MGYMLYAIYYISYIIYYIYITCYVLYIMCYILYIIYHPPLSFLPLVFYLPPKNHKCLQKIQQKNSNNISKTHPKTILKCTFLAPFWLQKAT